MIEVLAGYYEPDGHGRRKPESLYGATLFVYTAFAIDAFAGRIAGWQCSASKHTAFVESAIRQAASQRRLDGNPLLDNAIHHSDAGPQYTSVRFGETLMLAGLPRRRRRSAARWRAIRDPATS
jgi:transposase InsO family protein